MGVFRLLLLTCLCARVTCTYDCLCNYAVESAVYAKPNVSSSLYGYLYEFDCKPTIPSTPGSDSWTAIAIDHKVGYAKKGSDVQLQVCSGEPSPMDVVTTTIPKATTSMNAVSTKTTTSTTQATTTTTTTHAPTTTSTKSTTTTTMTQPTTSTTTQPTSTPTTQATRVVTQAATTHILSLNTTASRLPWLSTQPPVTVGNAALCPAILHQYAREDKGALTQYGNRCFEIVPIRAIWARAELDCRAKGGHLFHIEDRAQQQFIYNWIKSFKFDHAVWTGLNDLTNEEYFQWISGDHLIYTNWYPDRYGNLASHHLENCVLLVPYSPYFGQWDDVHCGINTAFGPSGQQNPFICEYAITPHHSSQPVVVG